MCYRVRPFYNIDGPVGKGVTGKSDDILLVKFFLTELTKVDMTWNAATPDVPLIVDGKPSEAFNQWILAFQTMIKNFRSVPVVADGRVDVVPRYQTELSPKQHAFYTLSWLNSNFELHFPDRFRDLGRDETAPQQLQTALRNNSR